MEEKRYWYILQIRTGNENKIINKIRRIFHNQTIYPFILQEELIHKYANKITKKEIKPIFPGYVFIETALDNKKIISHIRPFIQKNDDVIKILKYGDTNEYALEEKERQRYLCLFGEENFIQSSTGYMVGDKVYITQGALVGMESLIRRIDRHNRAAFLELDMMGQTIRVKVGLEIISKI